MKTIVLGAGVIGTTTAYYLAKAGHEVHVIDRQPEAAMEASFANGSVLHTSEAEAMVASRYAARGPRLAGQRRCADALRLGALPSMWKWGIDFIRHCTTERYRQAAGVNLRLAHHTLAVMEALRTDTGLEYDRAQRGTLKIYTRQAALDQNAAESALQAPLGLVYEVADAARCVTIEPALRTNPRTRSPAASMRRATSRATATNSPWGCDAIARRSLRNVPLQHYYQSHRTFG